MHCFCLSARIPSPCSMRRTMAAAASLAPERLDVLRGHAVYSPARQPQSAKGRGCD